MDVLFTPEEEAARDAEEARAAQEREQRAKDENAARERRAAAVAKLEALGISAEDLRDALA